jgi:hypothetical protein
MLIGAATNAPVSPPHRTIVVTRDFTATADAPGKVMPKGRNFH